MTRLILTIPLLAACACPLPDLVCDPVTNLCVCTGPTGSVTASGPDDRDRARPEPEDKPERPEKPEKEPEGPKEDPEPDREKEPEKHKDWKERQNG